MSKQSSKVRYLCGFMQQQHRYDAKCPVAIAGSQNCSVQYMVKSGDTVYSISSAHGTTIPALEAANPNIANPDEVFPGQTVCLPCTCCSARLRYALLSVPASLKDKAM